jgi:hypothetical protein
MSKPRRKPRKRPSPPLPAVGRYVLAFEAPDGSLHDPPIPPDQRITDDELKDIVRAAWNKLIQRYSAAGTVNRADELPGGLEPPVETCKVSGCMAVWGASYCGIPACLQGWAGDPESHRRHLEKCLFRQSQQTNSTVSSALAADTSGLGNHMRPHAQGLVTENSSGDSREAPPRVEPFGDPGFFGPEAPSEDEKPVEFAVAEVRAAMERLKADTSEPMTPEKGERIMAANGIHADNLAVHVEQRAAGIAMIDCRIGLQIVVERAFHNVPVNPADNTGGHGIVEAERTADREHRVTDVHLVAVAKLDVRQRVSSGVNAQQRDVCLARHAGNLSCVTNAVGSYDKYRARAFHHISVGADVS